MPRSGVLIPEMMFKQRRLPAAAGSDQHDLLGRGDLKSLDVEHSQDVAVRLPVRFEDVRQLKRHAACLVVGAGTDG